MEAGWWTLIGVGAGAVLGFVTAQGSERIRIRRQGRAAAVLIWSELSRSEALASAALDNEPGPGPVVPRFAFWEAHASALAEVVDPDVLMDLEIAYASAEVLGGYLSSGGEWAEDEEPAFEEWVKRLRGWIVAGKAAIEPYAKRRTLRSRLGLGGDS